MAARFKINKVSARRDDDRENVVGHVGFTWKPDAEFDEITTTKLVRGDDDKWQRRNAGRITGATEVRVYSADVMQYTNTKTGEVSQFLGIDGIGIPREVTDAIMVAALPLLAAAEIADAATPDDDTPV